jgi:hypothetical protein
VKDYGVESEGMHVLLDYFRNVCNWRRFRPAVLTELSISLAVKMRGMVLGSDSE